MRQKQENPDIRPNLNSRNDMLLISDNGLAIWRENGIFYYEPVYLYEKDPGNTIAEQMPAFDIDTAIKAGCTPENIALSWCRLWNELPPYNTVLQIVHAYINSVK